MAAWRDPLHASARYHALHYFLAKAEWSDDEMLRRVAQWVVPKMDFSAGGYSRQCSKGRHVTSMTGRSAGFALPS